MKETIKKTFTDSITQFLIDTGKNIIDLNNPLSACKLALETVEKYNEDRFIEEVLNGLKDVNVESLSAIKSLERLYKSVQVIAKATTKEKIERFKKLTINGIILQEKLSDNDYELYIRLVDELSDVEYFLLNLIYEKENKAGSKHLDIKLSEKLENEIIAAINIDKNMISSYVEILTGKGLITRYNKVMASYNDPFFISIVGGNISNLAKNLIDFINSVPKYTKGDNNA
jgi:hypothetical protein